MQVNRLNEMIKGWFVGDFDPVVLRTEAVEVAVKDYAAGDSEAAHYHKIATEVTVVTKGTVQMCGREFNAGEIITLLPGEATDFLALTNAQTVVVKLPGAKDDKYLVQ